MKDNYVRKALVTRVIDGDTIEARVDTGYDADRRVVIRFKDIDTPERGQDGYQEATDYVIERLMGNEDVYIESFMFKTGGFKRYLGIIYVNGENLNEELLKLGLAVPYVK